MIIRQIARKYMHTNVQQKATSFGYYNFLMSCTNCALLTVIYCNVEHSNDKKKIQSQKLHDLIKDCIQKK